MIHTSDALRTSSNNMTIRALAKFTTTSVGRRRTRSTTMPAKGANSDAMTPKKKVSPACGVGVGQLLHPDPQREEHRGVAEEGEALSDQIDASVTRFGEVAHASCVAPFESYRVRQHQRFNGERAFGSSGRIGDAVEVTAEDGEDLVP